MPNASPAPIQRKSYIDVDRSNKWRKETKVYEAVKAIARKVDGGDDDNAGDILLSTARRYYPNSFDTAIQIELERREELSYKGKWPSDVPQSDCAEIVQNLHKVMVQKLTVKSKTYTKCYISGIGMVISSPVSTKHVMTV